MALMNYAKYSCAIALLFNQCAVADVLVLTNGDRITGEISRIWDNEVTIEPAYSDEFTVDLDVVDHIESDRKFELELSDGTDIVAQLAGEDSAGKQILKTDEQTYAVEPMELYELDEVEEHFEWESHVDLTASLNSGNTDSSNSKLRADGMVRFGDHRHLADVSFVREEVNSVRSQDQDLYRYGYNWIFRDPWFFGAALSYESNPIIDLQSRYILTAGIGLDIWSTPRKSLRVLLGAGAQSEEIAMETGNSTVVSWNLDYRQEFFSDDFELYHNHSISENVSGRSNTSIKTTTGIRYEITDLLYTNISLDYDYESEPAGTAEPEDVALLFGFGLEF